MADLSEILFKTYLALRRYFVRTIVHYFQNTPNCKSEHYFQNCPKVLNIGDDSIRLFSVSPNFLKLKKLAYEQYKTEETNNY